MTLGDPGRVVSGEQGELTDIAVGFRGNTHLTGRLYHRLDGRFTDRARINVAKTNVTQSNVTSLSGCT